MFNSQNNPLIQNYFLEPGFIYVSEKPACISSVLGSCVSVCIFDRKKKCGGMNHFRLPFVGEKNQATALYGNVATVTLIRMMFEIGSNEKHLEAQIFGGAFNKNVSKTDIGEENIRIAKKTLTRFRVKTVSEDIGGMIGRKIVFNTETAELAVIRVEKLRRKDWYPYENDR